MIFMIFMIFIAVLQLRNENATQVFLKTAPEIAIVVQKADEYDRFFIVLKDVLTSIITIVFGSSFKF